MLRSKSPLIFPQSQNSLSRIIREQGLNYQQEVCGEDIQFDIKINGNSKKLMKQEKAQTTTKMKHFTSEENSPTQDSRKKQVSGKYAERNQFLVQKGQANRRDNSPLIELKPTDKKRNIIDLNELPADQRISRKEKKDKTTMDEQKTKKIQFQDLDRSKDELGRKKNSATKIKQKTKQVDSWKQGVLQLCSNQSSELQIQGQSSLLFQSVNENNKLITQQLKEMMSMIKWEYIEAQKIELRKFLSKLEGDIRKLKIGFRGLSQSTQNKSLTSKILSKSKIKPQQQPLSKQKLKKNQEMLMRGQSKIQKEKIQKNHLSLRDYGFDPFEVQHSNQFGSQEYEKLQKITEQIERQTKLSAKLALDYNEVSARLKRAQQQSQFKGSDSMLKGECKVSSSVIKRSKLIKEKLAFLKNEIKQTKSFYSNRIKRLKNQNNIIYNETRYVQKEIEQIKAILNSGQANNQNNLLSGRNSNQKKLNLENIHQSKPNGFLLMSNAKTTTSNSNRQITTIKSVQSLQNVKSLQSITSTKTLQSCNSNQNNLRLKKPESGQKQSSDYQLGSKPKLKINSPHLTPISSAENIKQYSILTKRKRQTEERLGRSGEQKNSSLDLAFKQLQQKYQVQVQEPNYQAEYYGSRY